MWVPLSFVWSTQAPSWGTSRSDLMLLLPDSASAHVCECLKMFKPEKKLANLRSFSLALKAAAGIIRKARSGYQGQSEERVVSKH